MAEELEALVCAADHIISRASPATSRASPEGAEGAEGAEEATAGMAMWQQVWCEQQAVGAHEVYATCEAETGGSGGDGGNASDASNGGSSDGRSASDGGSARGGGGGGAASDAAAEVLARGLRRGFAASAEWREGARERRDAYLTESTRAALAAL